MDILFLFLTAFLVAINSATIGTYLMLRKYSMLADAISHGVLPGIVIAYFLSKGKNDFSILLFSALFGVLVSYIIDWFTNKVKLFNDAAIGVSFTFLFSVGIILISKFGRNLDLDPECVLFGELAFTTFNMNHLGIPFALSNNIIFLIIILIFTLVFYKQMMLYTFDEPFFMSKGFKTVIFRFFLILLVSTACVMAFESIGSILVISFLISIPAISFLFFKRLSSILFFNAVISLIISFIGILGYQYFDTNIGGLMSFMLGAVLIVIVLIRKIVELRPFGKKYLSPHQRL